ncbi:MAG: hypothetical protein ING75_12885 [Rhodocyclaceae bacterium]|nr:hypothetical protein [Rhodocyclaceae bacterium]
MTKMALDVADRMIIEALRNVATDDPAELDDYLGEAARASPFIKARSTIAHSLQLAAE